MADKRPTVRQKYGKQLGHRPYQRDRPSAAQRGYDKHHRKWRKAILARDPICVHCERAPATEADHIIPISQGGSRFDLTNGRGLCKPCHTRRTLKDRYGNPDN